MYVVLSILSIFIVIVIHELAHAEAMRRYGIPIAKIGIGVPLPGVPPLGRFLSRKRYPGAEVTFNLLPIGAFVIPKDEASVGRLPLGKKAEVFGAGVLANCLLGLVCLAIILLFSERPLLDRLRLELFLVAGGAVLWQFRKIFFLLSPFLSFLIVQRLIRDTIGSAGEFVRNFGGPVTIVDLMARETKGPTDAVIWLGIVSITVALCNALPFIPLDGGRIVNALLERLFKREFPGFQYGSFLVFAGMVVLAIGNDLLLIFKMIF